MTTVVALLLVGCSGSGQPAPTLASGTTAPFSTAVGTTDVVTTATVPTTTTATTVTTATRWTVFPYQVDEIVGRRN